MNKPSRDDVTFGVSGIRFNWAMRLIDHPSLRARLAAWLHRIADRILPTDPPKAVGGKLLTFTPRGRNLGRSVLTVISVRGGFEMGTIQWSNQWNRASFKAHPEAIFDQQCIAEIYAAMREMK